jgi:tRNA threonylcarbamoyladenosine modification (KEOPS) complex  Pcc1 subunit
VINQKSRLYITSKVAIRFRDNQHCEIAYKSFIPEFNEKSKRSKITLQKRDDALIFTIVSKDITAFRAALNEIISFGKVYEKLIQLI